MMNDLERLAKDVMEKVDAEQTEAIDHLRRYLRRYLTNITDVTLIRTAAEAVTPHAEVSLPMYARLIKIDPKDINAIVSAGWVLWSIDENSSAMEKVQRAKSIDPNYVNAILLEAAIARDHETQKRLYLRVLEIEPGNDIAVGQLKELSSRNE